MMMKVFSVRDMKAEAFLQPFFSPTPGAALRAFGDACMKHDSPFNAHPADYILYEIGSYEDGSGLLVAVVPVKMMACAADYADKRGLVASQDSILGRENQLEVSNHGS